MFLLVNHLSDYMSIQARRKENGLWLWVILISTSYSNTVCEVACHFFSFCFNVSALVECLRNKYVTAFVGKKKISENQWLKEKSYKLAGGKKKSLDIQEERSISCQIVHSGISLRC